MNRLDHQAFCGGASAMTLKLRLDSGGFAFGGHSGPGSDFQGEHRDAPLTLRGMLIYAVILTAVIMVGLALIALQLT